MPRTFQVLTSHTLGFLLLASVVVIGCASKNESASAPPAGTVAQTPPPPAAGAPAPTEHGAATPAASISAADPVALWHDVRAEEHELGSFIQNAQLDKVHLAAFAIRDRVTALEKAHGSMAANSAALHRTVEKIRAMAGNLDAYGDKGDVDKTQAEFVRFQAALRELEASFPAGMLGKR